MNKRHFSQTLQGKNAQILLRWAGFLAVILWALALLRLNYWRIYDNTFWVDETWSIRLARMSLPDMVKKTATDMHPPLFYMLAMAMNRLLGDNGPAYHLSALLPYAGILFLACTEVRREFGLGPAFLLVTMMSLMPEPLYYNVEVRMYSLGAFLVLPAALCHGIQPDHLSGQPFGLQKGFYGGAPVYRLGIGQDQQGGTAA